MKAFKVLGENSEKYNGMCERLAEFDFYTQASIANALEEENKGFLEFWKFFYILNIPVGESVKATDGFVYFLQDQTNRHIKIGFTTKDPAARVRQFSGMNSGNAVIIKTFRTNRSLEKKIHKSLAQYNVHGEWFTEACLTMAIDIANEASA